MPFGKANKTRRKGGKSNAPIWWQRMSADKQRAYLKEHPNSRFSVKGGKGRIAGKPRAMKRHQIAPSTDMKPR